jgi:hypothetical protein
VSLDDSDEMLLAPPTCNCVIRLPWSAGALVSGASAPEITGEWRSIPV